MINFLHIRSVSVGRSFRLLFVLLLAGAGGLPAANSPLAVGVAQVDITPDYPVRLSGFGFRRTESEGVTQKIWAKALAIADQTEGPAILITVDNLCVPHEITQTIAERLANKVRLKPERLAITATHTHTAPMLKNVAPTLFGTNIPPAHQTNIDRYTSELVDLLEQVALAAVHDIQPANLSWGIGTVDFAINRRTKGGPVDHDLPVLVVRDFRGGVRAVYFSYACHCVTLSHNKISGDWAGYAQAAVQREFPGALALASVGCGADSNPSSGVSETNFAAAARQGEQIATEIKRLLRGELEPLTARPRTRSAQVTLPFDIPRTRADWEDRAKSTDYAVAYHARVNLARLDKGETLPAAMTYPIQTWLWGDELAMVFLPGETVVDYSLRLKREFDRGRLWVNGYSNEGRCYIPSERVLKEGGYEGGQAMIYYDRPQRFAPGLEQKIFDVVTAQLPKSFAAPKGTEGIPPQSPQKSLQSIRTRPGLVVELAAAEPLIRDPIAIDWDREGRLWVCEMNDYPAGLDQNWLPGGTVKLLEDKNQDGVYEKATIFAQGLPFPTGITAWGKGIFICAAPDIIYAEDTDGDGKADRLEKVFSGFATDNFQARVNSLSLGLDNWIYGANGLLGGVIRANADNFPIIQGYVRKPVTAPINIRNRDFRINPFSGEFQLASGLTQQGRVRDDWGNWFGCDNSQLLLYYPLAEQYIQRNPHVPADAPSVNLTARPEGNRVFPRSRLQERYNDLDQANRATSACGLGIYRDTLLGEEYFGNAFTAEPVHNLVHREILVSRNAGLTGQRAVTENQSEFFASSDNWCRPVQVRTGPDGALYVVDMYRFLIEHPRWIPVSRLAQLDVRAGSDMGRIYRIRPAQVPLRPIRNLSRLSTMALAKALDTPNGTDRDRVHAELLIRQDKAAAPELAKLARQGHLPQIRIQALCALDGLGMQTANLIERSLRDRDERVRQWAVRLTEPWLREEGRQTKTPAGMAGALLALTNDSSAAVRRQLAFTLGEWNDARAAQALASIAVRRVNEPALRAAVLSAPPKFGAGILTAIANLPAQTPGRGEWIQPLIATAVGAGDERGFAAALSALFPPGQSIGVAMDFGGLASWLAALERQRLTARDYLSTHPQLARFAGSLADASAAARKLAQDTSSSEDRREAALGVVGRAATEAGDLDLLIQITSTSGSSKLRAAAVAGLRRNHSSNVTQRLLQQWPQLSPVARSQIGALLMERTDATIALLQAIEAGTVQPAEISLSDRQRLQQSDHPEVRALVSKIFPAAPVDSQAALYARYRAAIAAPGNIVNGAEIFLQNCASCHELNGKGHDVGPRLVALRDKEADYWLKNILEPNAVVEPKFVSYQIDLKDERSLTGLIKTESATSLVLAMGSGLTETIFRSEIKGIRASNTSLMPEGLAQVISPPAMADLIAYVRSNPAPAPAPATPAAAETVLRDPVSVARFILDPAQPQTLRETTVKANPQFAADLIAEFARDLVPGTPEEYVRIPWLWRVAVAAGKRNDSGQLKRIMTRALPESAEPLRDWQAVVLGGGVINGISLRGGWPRVRLAEILAADTELQTRWNRALELAGPLADNTNVTPGTRYDALRMLGAGLWEKTGPQLVRYLTDKNEELQMGAVSGLSDIDSPEAATALMTSYRLFTDTNRRLAVAALLRNDARVASLLDALGAGTIPLATLTDSQKQELTSWPDEKLRARARALLAGKKE